jgi:hypothetical protein
VFDVTRRRTVLVAGSQTAGPTDDAWTYDGTNWIQDQVLARPPRRSQHSAAYDTRRQRVIVFGGFGDNGALDDTWTLGYATDATEELCHLSIDFDGDGAAGCADPECWSTCTPACPPDAVSWCISSPRCGDGQCDPSETCRNCAMDCACTLVCGDDHCDPGETAATCVADCP